ncbi:non-ribosomal peptide synthetase [Massilia rubra]|uniref:Non-ribosomal peptide synthetase n=1 Tax=Massilia rubra TaxID=2607910 RepID=A0ABX0LPH2_9BURK|nr:non-ribosomal peptide synthetase [Massilia rubra]NHZ36791.1 non-ribosomal peptide synthetase [Massilia rubra]
MQTQTETLGPVLARGSFATRRDAVAIDCDGQLTSYAELDAQAHAIARAMDDLAIAPHSHIGILARRTDVIVAAMLAIMARGGVFVVLEPGQAAPMLKSKTEAGDIRCLIVEPGHMSDALAGLPTVLVDWRIAARAGRAGDATIVPGLAAATGVPLYLYFTSGTAGPAKSILGRSDSLLHFLQWEIATFGLERTVRVAQLTPPQHDPFLRDIFIPLVTGGTICAPRSRQIVLSPPDFVRWLDSAGINLMHCTPTVFRNMCNGPLEGALFTHLKHILIAGEQLRGAHVRRWYEVFGERVGLVNLYGPTETTLAKLFYRLTPGDSDRRVIPIGMPMEGARAHIEASVDNPGDPDGCGELFIETRFASLGYFRRPDLNQARFSADPCIAQNDPICFRTGDIVRRLPEGVFEFIGRRDRQDKLRGQRIDLGEVEDTLLRRAPMQSVVVTVLVDESGRMPDRLAAFYVADGELDESKVREQLTRDLPALMIPDVWERVGSLPTNANGKIDIATLAMDIQARAALPEREIRAEGEGDARLVDELLAIWKEILQIHDLGPEDTFMDAGGDSLSIMLLIARLDEQFGYELTLWNVFDDLTVAKLCLLMQSEAA